MTPEEYSDLLNELSDAALAKFKYDLGGEPGLTREQLVKNFAWDRKHESVICHLLSVPTENDRLNKAQYIASDAAIASARHAKEANEHLIEANRLSIEANQIATAANETADKSNVIASEALSDARDAKKKSKTSTVTAWIAILISLAKFAYDVITAYVKAAT